MAQTSSEHICALVTIQLLVDTQVPHSVNCDYDYCYSVYVVLQVVP